MGEKAVIPSYSIVGRIERQVYPRYTKDKNLVGSSGKF
jgi:tetrahydromethanopterin S-methyltransferase subunit D